MTFGRWLLVHSLSISILLMLGVGYMFKNELKLNEAYRQLLKIDADTISLSSKENNEDDQNSKDSKKTVRELEESKATKENTLSFKAPIEQKDPAVSTLSMNDTDKEEAKITAKLSYPKETELNTIISESIEPSKVEEVTESENHLLSARQAYWNKDYQSAIDFYSKAMTNSPNSSDLYGELGNLYYGLKDYDLASSNYLEAGSLMIKNNEDNRAKQIYDILLSIAPDKAKLLLALKNEHNQ